MRRFLVASLLITVISGCGGSEATELPAGPAKSGAELFDAKVLGGNPGCVTCHSLSPGTNLIGPSLAGIATRAADRIAGTSAAEYLHGSITSPAAFIVGGYKDQMPDDWSEVLTAAEIDALVAYLLTLE